jgi:O-antigen ligase
VQAIAANPLVGYGVGTNEYVLHRLFPNGVMTVFPAVVHLGYLQLWLEVGLLGLAVFLTPMIFLLRYCLMPRGHAELPQYFRIGLINGVVVALVFWLLLPHIGIIEFPFLGIPLGLGSFWYYLARSDKKGI